MNRKKRIILAAILLILIILGAYGGIRFMENIKEKEKMAQEEAEKERIMRLYQKAHYAILQSTGYELYLEQDGYYRVLPQVEEYYNENKVEYHIYLPLKLYEKETGKVLSYETVMEYFSQEYESDGSLRLYNNGLHPEFEAYVEWAWGRGDDIDAYIRRIDEIYAEYYFENEDRGFRIQSFSAISRQMLDELVKKEADPNYDMDLLSLQQQGY